MAAILLSCGTSNPCQVDLDRLEKKTLCLSRCLEDYKQRTPQCFDRFWDSDKSRCIEQADQDLTTCETRCAEDFGP